MLCSMYCKRILLVIVQISRHTVCFQLCPVSLAYSCTLHFPEQFPVIAVGSECCKNQTTPLLVMHIEVVIMVSYDCTDEPGQLV